MKKEFQAGTEDEQRTAADKSTSASVEANPMLPAVPSVSDVFHSAKYYFVNKKEETISCFMNEIGEGFEGYNLSIKYLHGDGYRWELSGFKSGNSFIQNMIESNPEFLTKDKFKAVCLLGVCPKCKGLLFDEFTNALHNVHTCGMPKKAVAERSEWA